MHISMAFIWILWHCFRSHWCCKFPGLEYNLVKNLSLSIRNKEGFLTWDCDIPMENVSNISYEIFLKLEDWEFVKDAHVCGEAISLSLLDDAPSPVCVLVTPYLNLEKCQNASICLNPGRNQMAENIECIVYNVSSMKCTWSYGKNLQYKTEHNLSLEQDATIINCQQYVNDLEMRTGSCTFHNLTVHYFKEVTIILNRKGSENHVLKDTFKLAEKEIFSPPNNLTVGYSKENVIWSWTRPHTQYAVSQSCFNYQMENNKKLIDDVSSPFSISNLDKECLIRIRARGDHTCGMNTNWGQWSGEISCDVPQEQSDKTDFIILIILLGLSCLIILLTIIISIQYKRISTLFFPRIPQPKNYFDEPQNYKTDTKIDLMSPVLSTSETEEYICLQENNA
ncbi:interleukin-5 receptor subunit alpha-like isoform X1 [Bufo gargarizans]|uniref:interleukin-5 receptor subunit alpha-like isoform X1 n=1 Tax=Bufo gargarizans TaxID=30331 RepID=UPI001CF59609|nr:interleukin-5 receptor subunit alpha-like isoform X1 [Bufo gargarizans]XP_044139952.1 interleukin-5 receptor subunit alpha-like isoform X1 [Bufo gargarizans]